MLGWKWKPKTAWSHHSLRFPLVRSFSCLYYKDKSWCRHVSGALISYMLRTKPSAPTAHISVEDWVTPDEIPHLNTCCSRSQGLFWKRIKMWEEISIFIFNDFPCGRLKTHLWEDICDLLLVLSVVLHRAACLGCWGCTRVLLGQRFWGYNNEQEYFTDQQTCPFAKGKLIYYVNKCSQGSI